MIHLTRRGSIRTVPTLDEAAEQPRAARPPSSPPGPPRRFPSRRCRVRFPAPQSPQRPASAESAHSVPGWLVGLLAVASGMTVANLYYAQPLLSSLSQVFHLDTATAGLLITVTQIGYVVGMLLLVPARRPAGEAPTGHRAARRRHPSRSRWPVSRPASHAAHRVAGQRRHLGRRPDPGPLTPRASPPTTPAAASSAASSAACSPASCSPARSAVWSPTSRAGAYVYFGSAPDGAPRPGAARGTAASKPPPRRSPTARCCAPRSGWCAPTPRCCAGGCTRQRCTPRSALSGPPSPSCSPGRGSTTRRSASESSRSSAPQVPRSPRCAGHWADRDLARPMTGTAFVAAALAFALAGLGQRQHHPHRPRRRSSSTWPYRPPSSSASTPSTSSTPAPVHGSTAPSSPSSSSAAHPAPSSDRSPAPAGQGSPSSVSSAPARPPLLDDRAPLRPKGCSHDRGGLNPVIPLTGPPATPGAWRAVARRAEARARAARAALIPPSRPPCGG